MTRQPNELFDKAKIKKYCSDIQITDEQRDAAKEWLDLLNKNKLEKEDQNRSIFEQVILQKILGYSVYDYVPEKDNIDYTISNRESSKSLCIEVKGTSTKDLFAYQNRGKKDQENPVKQTWSYMGLGHDYGLCTNYDDFVLLSRNVGFEKVYKFNFSTLKGIQNKLDEEKLKEFIGIFAKRRIFDEDIITKLTNESILAEQEFTDEFYKLFHETRLMLIEEFSSLPDVTRVEAIHWAQIYLNRLIFVFFVEDHNFIPTKIFHKRIMDIIKSPSISEYTHLISDNINDLFKIMNNGSKVHGIYGFNGGLFEKQIPSKIFFADLKDPQFFKEDIKQNSKLSKKSLVIDIDISLSNRYADLLNPIIKNLLNMDSYDFTSDLNVNILGHIFEQSISDLEKLHEEKSSKRKREGIFYTPQYITDYICRNTIIPYLSKKGNTSVKELIEEYVDTLEELEKKIKDIKILDPACGSGAFLIKTVEILLEIDKEIQELKPILPEQTQLKNWSQESEIAKIIEDNIHGVDINEESVEITKLSLFIKLASPNKKLIDLGKNIKVGNSLINDKIIDPKGFDWKDQFREIFDKGGFDIVIGNPPYVRQELIKKYSSYLKNNYKAFAGKADLYVYFIEKAYHLLKEKGFLGFITSGKFLEAGYGKQLLNFISSNLELKHVINFGDLPIFKDVTAYPLILVALKNKNNSYQFTYNKISKLDFIDLHRKLSTQKPMMIDVDDFKSNGYKFFSKEINAIINKISNNSISLKEFCGLPLVGIKTGYNKGYLTNEDNSKLIKPYVFGRDIKRYGHATSNTKVIFPYVYEKSSYNLVNISDHKKIEELLLTHKIKLEKRAIIKEGLKKGNKTWYEYQQINKNINFDSEHIVYPNVSLGNNFTISSGNIIDMTGFIIPSNNRYILAILNSQLVEFLMKLWAISRRGGYLEYKVQYLTKIPIKKISDKEQELFVEKANYILSQQKELSLKKQKFMNRVYSELKITKSTKKIESFFKTTFSEFMKEIKKKSDVRPSLQEQDEWEDYFEQYKKDILELRNEIEKADKDLNGLVYKLYDIDSDEKKVIVESLEK